MRSRPNLPGLTKPAREGPSWTRRSGACRDPAWGPGQKRSHRPTPRNSIAHPLGAWLPSTASPGPREMLYRPEVPLGNWGNRAGAGVFHPVPQGRGQRGFQWEMVELWIPAAAGHLADATLRKISRGNNPGKDRALGTGTKEGPGSGQDALGWPLPVRTWGFYQQHPPPPGSSH